ncbi:MAG: hypothetical protein JXB17_12700 [Bacteroidales bacterium]|nr:hypothetical protein [Bacteroidales bacterium]
MKIEIFLTFVAFAPLFLSCEKNSDPVLSGISDQSIAAGQTKNVELSATDADGNSLSFSIPTNPGFLSITGFSQTGNKATATLVIEPGDDSEGNYDVTIQVDDGEGGTDSETFTIIIEPSLKSYFPIASGIKWNYKVNFPDKVYVPYSPVIESPENLLCASEICGTKSWDASNINFSIEVNDKKESSASSTTWDISLSDIGLEFYFDISEEATTELRIITSDSTVKFDLLASLYLNNSTITGTGELSLSELIDYQSHDYTIRYRLAYLKENTISEKYTITTPAGTYENCVKSVVKIYGVSPYLSGSYPVETYLAPNVGIVKAIGKDSDETTLYTLELTEFSN